MIITRTPYRISFFGGGTDHPVWYRKYGGCVLSTTIDKYCYISCRYLPPFFPHKFRIVWSKIERIKNIDRIINPVVRESLKFMKVKAGLEIHYDSDLPARTGMGSSSAFTVGLLHALHGLKGKIVSKQNLALDAILVEQKKIKDKVGSQDQIAAAFGGLNKIEFFENGEIKVKPVILRQKIMKSLKKRLLVFFTGFTRYATKIEEEKLKNFDRKKIELRKIMEMVDDGINLLSKNSLDDFGSLLHENWLFKKSLSQNVSNSDIDNIYALAKENGASGGKIIGAGGGGFLLLYVKPEFQAIIRKKLKKLLEIPFNFENSGSQVVFYKPEYFYESRKLKAS